MIIKRNKDNAITLEYLRNGIIDNLIAFKINTGLEVFDEVLRYVEINTVLKEHLKHQQYDISFVEVGAMSSMEFIRNFSYILFSKTHEGRRFLEYNYNDIYDFLLIMQLYDVLNVISKVEHYCGVTTYEDGMTIKSFVQISDVKVKDQELDDIDTIINNGLRNLFHKVDYLLYKLDTIQDLRKSVKKLKHPDVEITNKQIVKIKGARSQHYAIYHAIRVQLGDFGFIPTETTTSQGIKRFSSDRIKELCRDEYPNVSAHGFYVNIKSIVDIDTMRLKSHLLNNSYGNWQQKVSAIAKKLNDFKVINFIKDI